MKRNLDLLFNLNKYNYSKTAIDNIPQTGMVGYITNNPISTYDFLIEPATRFNFNIKNFSQLKNTPLKKKIQLSNIYPLESELYDIYSLENQKRLNNHLFEDFGLNFLQDFPKDIEEAEELEKITGGLNLFICFNYLTYEKSTEVQKNTYLLGSNGTVKVLDKNPDSDNLEENLEEENGTFEAMKKGVDPHVLTEVNFNEEFEEINEFDNKNKNYEDLLKFYQEKGLLMFFDVHPKEDIDSTRFRFLNELIKSYKY